MEADSSWPFTDNSAGVSNRDTGFTENGHNPKASRYSHVRTKVHAVEGSGGLRRWWTR